MTVFCTRPCCTPGARFLASLALLFLSSFASVSLAQSVPSNGKLKVFVLAGQSNMQGHGVIELNPERNEGKGSLEYLVKNNPKKYGHLVGPGGKWKPRKDVWIWYLDRKGELNAGYGANENLIGPELQFGHVMGDHFEDQVLIIKTAWGGKSVAVDFRSPSAGKTGPEFSEKFLEELKGQPDKVGFYYREMLKLTRGVLDDIRGQFPKYGGKGYELLGIAWHQGWNDRVNQGFNDHYRDNLACMIRDLRKDLARPGLPFVLAETGMSGFEEKHPRAVSLMKHQAAVAELPEFRGNVGFVGTRAFFRPREDSPSGQAYHWNTNAETYCLIGEGLARSLIQLLD